MKKLIILLTVLLALGSSCKKDFLNVDEVNPNQASAVPANLVLPAALNSVAVQIDQPDNYAFVYLWYGQWCVLNGYVQPSTLTAYDLLNGSYEGIWNNSYLALQNFDYVEQASKASKDKNFRAIAVIMKVLLFHNLVDAYGNIPYSQALKGSATTQVLKPVYDDQKTVYEDLVAKIDTAINLIQTAPVDANAVGAADIIYQGDMTLWAKFANTIKLRMLMNQSGMDSRASYISGALATTAAVGYLGAGEGAMLNPGYLQTTNKMNPFWENFYKQDGSQQADALAYYGASQDACDFMTANSDPRSLLFFQPITGSTTTIQGNYFAAALLRTVPQTSKLGPGLLQKYNQDAPILTDYESLFLQAEAAQRGFITADPKALYESAVTESILYLRGSAASAVAYLGQSGKPLVNYDSNPNKLQAIMTQKWVAMIGITPMTTWTDYRRTGYPDFLHFSQDPARKNDTPPVRLLYPQSEISTNNDNVLAQGTINLFSSKIFWQNR